MFKKMKKLEERLERIEKVIGTSYLIYSKWSIETRLGENQAALKELRENHRELVETLKEGLLLAGVEYYEEEPKPPKEGWRKVENEE